MAYFLDENARNDEGEDHGEHIRYNGNTRPGSRVVSDSLEKEWEIVCKIEGGQINKQKKQIFELSRTDSQEHVEEGEKSCERCTPSLNDNGLSVDLDHRSVKKAILRYALCLSFEQN
jgi:hypothetical protein